MTTTRMSRRALSSLRGFAPRAAAAREYSGYRVVTPRVPPWRAGDDAVTALSWLRHLRHAPPGSSASARSSGERPREGAAGGAAVFKLFRDRRVRVGTGELEKSRGGCSTVAR